MSRCGERTALFVFYEEKLATALTFTQEARDAMQGGAQIPANDGRSVPRELGDPDKQQDKGLGPNNEKLDEQFPEVVAALRQLMLDFRMEGIVGRRHEIRKIKQARLFWQGLQYLYGWDADNMEWRMPFGAGGAGTGLSIDEDRDAVEGGRYQFVTNFYQAMGLSFISVVSQDVPTIHWYPQNAQNEQDLATAKAASDVSDLVAENNFVDQLLINIGFYLWCDGVVAAYVRSVTDGQRFGFHDSPQMEAQEQKFGEDAFECPNCAAQTAPGQMFAGMICPNCGTAMSQENFKPAPMVKVPVVTAVNKVPNGQELISIYGGLEVNRPIYTDDPVMDGAYLQLQLEVHEAKLRAAYPHAKDKIRPGNPGDAEDVYARSSRVSVKQGLPTTHPGDALYSLITFSRSWFEPWVFHSEKVKEDVRAKLLELFPDGCYVAFAGEGYCESRNESKKDHWRVLQPLPGDGQNRPAVGSSLISVQERYNILSNTFQENAEFGIPPLYADPQVLDFDAVANQTAEPAAHYPARARPGQPLAAGFFQPQAGQLPPDTMEQMDKMFSGISQFLSGLFPAVFGGAMQGSKTAEEYAMARDQALGRLGLYWRGIKIFWAQTMQLAVKCFRDNRPEDVQIPILGSNGDFESKVIRIADLQGNLQARPEADETFPRLKSQQKSVILQMLAGADANPVMAQIFAEPANLGEVKRTLGMKDIVIPGEDSRNKQLREIAMLMQGQPIQAMDEMGQPAMQSTVPIQALDRHDVEFEECKRWANSEAGQAARMQNPAGFANVEAHAGEHQKQLQQQDEAKKPPSESINFKDLPPDGKAQMAQQAGIALNPAEIAVKEQQDKADKAAELQARLGNKEKAR